MEWIFVCPLLPGSYCSVLPDGTKEWYTGLSMYLGVEKGSNPNQAFKQLYEKHDFDYIPDLKKSKIYAFPINGNPVTINVEKALLENIDEKDPKDNSVICEWCGEKLPPHGAARFSHLKKHVNQLLRKKLLTEEQASTINSITLKDKMKKIFAKAFKKLN